MVLLGLIGRLLLPFDPVRVGRFLPSLPPSSEHILGTDSFGRDVYGQLVTGIILSIQIGFTVAAIGSFVGSIIGFMSGYFGGKVDNLLRSIIDVFLVIPMLAMLILISASIRVLDIPTMSLVLVIFAWASPARQVRGQTLSLKERDFIYMAKLSGMNPLEIILWEISPHMAQWISASFINTILWAILTETSLDILGLGPLKAMSLGMLLYWSIFHAAMFRGLWWWWTAPIYTLTFLFLSLFLMHRGLDEMINPMFRTKGA